MCRLSGGCVSLWWVVWNVRRLCGDYGGLYRLSHDCRGSMLSCVNCAFFKVGCEESKVAISGLCWALWSLRRAMPGALVGLVRVQAALPFSGDLSSHSVKPVYRASYRRSAKTQ